ncbi:MAG: hypothetical protein KDA45_17280, partial [Planctomycetales bacterium]|nr:hypothetical protein [Planctomycetales bacterium]
KVLSLAADEGIEVQRVRPPRHMRTTTRPRYYFDDAAVEQLWRAAGSLAWPPARVAKPRKGTVFVGSGVDPADFWRSLFILLRNYGMRVQDLVAYAARKRPLMWGDVHFDARSPNPESLETWPLGWLYYRAAKTADSSGKEYYLPMTVSARAAIDRLRAGAQQLHGQRIPSDAPVFCCPKSHGLTAGFKALQKLAGVATRSGEPYELEDFRKTVATYSATVDGDLPHALCGWGPGGGVKTRHYQQPEPLLVRKLHQVPLPSCFAEWTNPAHAEAVAAFAAAL